MRMSVVPLIFFDDIAIRRTRTLGEVAGIVRELGAEGIEAYYKSVSYTHLDVYKRQSIFSVGIL